MNRKLERKLTHIFGMTRKRDRILGDLLYTLRTEGNCAHTEKLALDLAHLYNRSEDIGRCLCATVRYIDETAGPGEAYSLASRMALTANGGPVSLMLTVLLPDLKRRAEMEPGIKRDTCRFLDRIRYKGLDEEAMLRPTMMCFNKPDSRYRGTHPRLESTRPYEFVHKLENL